MPNRLVSKLKDVTDTFVTYLLLTNFQVEVRLEPYPYT